MAEARICKPMCNVYTRATSSVRLQSFFVFLFKEKGLFNRMQVLYAFLLAGTTVP